MASLPSGRPGSACSSSSRYARAPGRCTGRGNTVLADPPPPRTRSSLVPLVEGEPGCGTAPSPTVRSGTDARLTQAGRGECRVWWSGVVWSLLLKEPACTLPANVITYAQLTMVAQGQTQGAYKYLPMAQPQLGCHAWVFESFPMSSRKRLTVGWAVFALLLITSVLAVLQPDWIVAALAKRSPEVVYFVETDE